MKKSYQNPEICLICVDANLLTGLGSGEDCKVQSILWNDGSENDGNIFD